MGAARRGGASISKEHVMSQAETSVTVSSMPVSGAGPVGGWGAERMARGPVGGW